MVKRRLPKDGDVHRAPDLAQANMPPRHLAVHHAKPEIKTSRFSPCSAFPPSKPVPKCCNKLFDEVDHHGLIVRGAVTKSVTTAR
jgi:hypothetical protein